MLDKLNNVRHITLTVEISGLEKLFLVIKETKKFFLSLLVVYVVDFLAGKFPNPKCQFRVVRLMDAWS